MKVLEFSDLHGHAFKPYSVKLPSGRNSRLQDAVAVLDEIYQACLVHEIDIVLFLGDLFHARDTLAVPTFNAIYEGVARIKTRVDDLGLLVGNHDQVTKQGEIHSIYSFDAIAQVMDSAGWYSFHSRKENRQLHVFAIPYTEDKERIEAYLQLSCSSMPPGETTCCVAHLGISGAKVGSNYVLTSKDNPTVVPFAQQKFSQVFLGHYHQHQLLAPNIRYLGATHQHNWGDVGQQRGYHIWDTIENTVEFFEIESAPKFVKWDANKMASAAEMKAAMEGNFVRIEYDELLDPATWKKVKEQMLEFGARRVEQWVEPTLVSALSPEDVERYQPGLDFEDMIDSYVADSNCGTLDEEMLIRLGKSILKGVQ
jgi:DNA repair exonuclease SbcCD nuclease subunit